MHRILILIVAVHLVVSSLATLFIAPRSISMVATGTSLQMLCLASALVCAAGFFVTVLYLSRRIRPVSGALVGLLCGLRCCWQRCSIVPVPGGRPEASMRRVFSSNVLSETILVRDALQQHGIQVSIQNENSGYSAVPEFRPPAELWVSPESDYDKARKVVIDTLATLDSKAAARPWVCGNCREDNPQSFEVCWNCGRSGD